MITIRSEKVAWPDPSLTASFECKDVKNNVDKKESKKEEKQGKDDKVGGKENGVGSGVEVQAEGKQYVFSSL